MHLIQHEPSAHANARLRRYERCEASFVRIGMRGTYPRRDLDDDTPAFVPVLMFGEPEVKILVAFGGRVAVRRFRNFQLETVDIALHLDGRALEAFHVVGLALR